MTSSRSIVLLALRTPITDELLDGTNVLYWVLVVGIAGFGAAYYARGFLAGRRQFGLYATLLVLEGGSRLMFPVAVAVGIAEGVDAVALGVAVAPLASLTVLPLAFARHRQGTVTVAPGDSGLEFTLARGGAFAAAVLLMMLSEQVLVSSGALFVRGALDADAAGPHLQHPDGRAGAAASVPGGRRQPSPPPHPAAHARRRDRRGRLPDVDQQHPADHRRRSPPPSPSGCSRSAPR